MGGNSQSTPQGMGQLFGQNPGYQQPNQVAPITQPQLQTPILPTPEQAAAATRARMLARSPMAAPVAAPQKPQAYIQRGGEGGGPRGAASGGNGNGWSGH
jgi:hypothetical protein